MKLNIVLVEPEIPQNTGNIARTCAAIGARLHLVYPLGFNISEKQVNRAGLDYWDKLDIRYYDNIEDFFSKNEGNMFFFTTKTTRNYSCVSYTGNVFLIFGKETRGLPESIINAYPENCVRIPMRNTLRCLNLSNAAAVAVYEVLRQFDYPDMQ